MLAQWSKNIPLKFVFYVALQYMMLKKSVINVNIL